MQTQAEANGFMVEGSPIYSCWFPGNAVMAVRTVHAKHADMLGRFLVTGNTGRFGLIERIILVAVSASDLTVLTGQGKIRLVMVES
jgi:hypothetical protein